MTIAVNTGATRCPNCQSMWRQGRRLPRRYCSICALKYPEHAAELEAKYAARLARKVKR